MTRRDRAFIGIAALIVVAVVVAATAIILASSGSSSRQAAAMPKKSAATTTPTTAPPAPVPAPAPAPTCSDGYTADDVAWQKSALSYSIDGLYSDQYRVGDKVYFETTLSSMEVWNSPLVEGSNGAGWVALDVADKCLLRDKTAGDTVSVWGTIAESPYPFMNNSGTWITIPRIEVKYMEVGSARNMVPSTGGHD